ncbi:MAG: hypothetical protein Q4D82_08265, partial [Neisseria sp.]|nr:hypothetical protein [Neisseria sp.]
MPNKLLCLAAAVSLSACSYFSAPSQTGFQTAANTAPQQLDELMSAQAAFRQALSAQNSGDSVIINLQNKLADAQKRKLEAEADIQRLSAELTA